MACARGGATVHMSWCVPGGLPPGPDHAAAILTPRGPVPRHPRYATQNQVLNWISKAANWTTESTSTAP